MQMPLGGEIPQPPDVLQIFDTLVNQSGRVENLQSLRSFFTDALTVVENPETCNQSLRHAGLEDLAITTPARLAPLANPNNLLDNYDNFIYKFECNSALLPVVRGEVTTTEPVRITESELDGIANGTFEPLPSAEMFSHMGKPAFRRLLVLFPEFTKRLVLSMSGPDGKKSPNRKLLFPEFFVAYQLMSRLLDAADPHVMHGDAASVNEHYLRS